MFVILVYDVNQKRGRQSTEDRTEVFDVGAEFRVGRGDK